MYSKLILAAIAASALLAISVGVASASRLSTNERNFELIWNETLTEAGGRNKTKLSFTAAGNTVECRVTLLGRFTENTIKKETALNQNTINHGELESCTGGTATIRTETMPWISRYRSFEESLPRIRSVSIGLIRATFAIEAGGHTCEAGTEVNRPAVGIAGNSRQRSESGFVNTGEPENITAEEGNRIRLGGEFVCFFAGEGEFRGIGLVRNLPRTAKLRITLI